MSDYASRRRMMVDTQVRPSDVTKFPIIDAMLAIPREVFVPRDRSEAAYASENVAIGGGRVLLEPRTFAKMLDAVNVTNADLVLDVAAGLGYSSAVVARIAEAVVAVEDDADRAKEAQSLLSDQQSDNVIVHCGPLNQGEAGHGPYDAILIEGAIEELPDAISAQLKEGGRIAAVFMEGALGVVRIGHKIDGTIAWRFAFNASAPVLPGFEKQRTFAL
ncbi:protein-L-isoaspartate O-methyltransferase [Puniceibacterium sp. IMCC21224]|uniref:protein-L-isoaspartate O-methyltransferase family protein n=1 Tax=Puniceibacterium sp. IMCC21224 TaxID=1618204 RepID=UPI00064D8578|nr:protein-L-isoaspartate O-methyltransferase [Puniceibacterium sp. IMCC21224]KMK66113.1 protein-L-isoaspartate carboxylmethyltransferase [Puniceibacterium sp. IMCC21224]